MTVIYQGGGITEYHLNSGQVITLNEQESEELFDIGGVPLEDMESDYNDYHELLDELKADKELTMPYELYEALKEVRVLLNASYKDGEDKQDVINYLRDWIEDEV